jgi:hypothetical protein
MQWAKETFARFNIDYSYTNRPGQGQFPEDSIIAITPRSQARSTAP